MSGRTSPFALPVVVACIAACTLSAGCSSPKPDVNAAATAAPAVNVAAPAPAAPDPVARGKYLVAVGGCVDCHTPLKMGPKGPEPDMAQMLSGHPADMALPPAPKPVGPWVWSGTATNTAFAGPWGVSYAINLTPDEETGIGSWTEQVFVTSLKTGKHLGVGRPIMPPMPWQGYSQMTDEDLKALFTYLKTVPAKKNKVPEAVVAPPPPAS